MSHIGSSKWRYVSVYHWLHLIFITILNLHEMETNSDQYSWTPHDCLILHTIWLFCISWWDCVGWMFEEAYLGSTAPIIIIHPHHLTARRVHAPQAAVYGLADTPESGTSSTSWCSVGSSGHAGLPSVPILRAGGDHSVCYHNNWAQCSIAMGVERCFAPVGQPVPMPGAAHSIPRTSQSLPHGVLLRDLGLSHPMWV